jgi:hypothetical protein
VGKSCFFRTVWVGDFASLKRKADTSTLKIIWMLRQKKNGVAQHGHPVEGVLYVTPYFIQVKPRPFD